MTLHRPGANRLRNASSPYLQQHASNPVDWNPWDQDALALAKQQDKPILLSIGYSACHWCHVMAHESFEHQDTADLMNQFFVNIKVDREERPDLDRIYQSAHQLLAQRPGGWPLTVFLSPDDLTPFFSGTYFPREPRHGLPAFRDLLQSLDQAYHAHRKDIEKQNLSLRQALNSLNPSGAAGGVVMGDAPLQAARQQLEKSFDQRHGGFGQAPKFPHATNIERLLRHWASSTLAGKPDERALQMAVDTLAQMARGGINDQLGGGFCRYSVDDLWMIPHFEKMLYDNGPLLALYTDAWLATGNPLFSDTAQRTADWAIREMQSPEGGYYSSLDADSEGEEGKFYVWRPQQVEELLDGDEYAVFSRHFGLDRQANFEDHWHFHTFVDIPELCGELGISPEQAKARLDRARRKLFEARQGRIPPGRDEKILTSWNALMIKGMARAGRLLKKPAYLDSSFKALDFVRSSLWQNGRLLATWKDGTASLAAYLDDYAFLIEALLETLQARWRRRDLDFCLELAEVMLRHFEDQRLGGFYFTADDHEDLIYRPKSLGDDSIPSGNGVAAFALARLGHLLGETRYLDAAEKVLKAAWSNVRQLPYAHCGLLHALEEHLQPTETLVVRGNAEEIEKWQGRAAECYAPNRHCIGIPASEQGLPGLLNERASGAEAVGYLCSGSSCRAPIRDYATLDRELRRSEPLRPPP